MNDSNSTALQWSSSLCSVLGLVAVFVLQNTELNLYSLLFWWITTVLIAIAAISTCFTPPTLPLRIVFAIVFVAQLPAFDWAWGQMHERDTIMGIGLVSSDPEIAKLKNENERLNVANMKLEAKLNEHYLFWRGIAHLLGIGFALLGCTAAGQKRIRIVYEDS